MASDTCADCGTVNERPATAERVPCPVCASTNLIMDAEIGVYAVVGMDAELTVIDYPQLMLEHAKSLIGHDTEQFNAEVSNGLAVILCHIACEIAVQRALRNAFIRRGIEDMERAVTKLMNGYNLGNERYRKLYTVTSGDDIAQQPFWQEFKASAERRNDMTHDGKRASDDEATKSFDAAKAFVNHVTTFSRQQTVAHRAAHQAP